jgi:hypothetical protein
VLLVQLGPEESDKLVSAVEPLRGGDGQVGQEGQALRLGQDRTDLLALRIPEIE